MKQKYLASVAVALAAALLGGCSLFETKPQGGGSSATTAQTSAPSYSGMSGYGFAALTTDDERQLYAYIDNAAKSYEPYEFTTPMNEAYLRLSDIIDFYKNDHPEVFWLSDGSPYSFHIDNGNVTVTPSVKQTGDALRTMQQTFNARVDEIVAAAPQNASAYELELYVNDWLVDNCRYDDEAVEYHNQNNVPMGNEQNAYGALVEGRAVCEGYARAFQLLCARLGVECKVIDGFAKGFHGDGGSSAHVWNAVQLDGSWYYVDPTWNDTDENDEYYSARCYYVNLTTGLLCLDHDISPTYDNFSQGDIHYNDFVPACDNTYYYYFNQSATLIDDLDSDRPAQAIADAAASGKAYCDFIIADSLDFESTNDLISSEYGSRWLNEANEINGWYPSVSTSGTMNIVPDRRLITIDLSYE